jgi:biofilm PGA synthesis lipoprotein PgaB
VPSASMLALLFAAAPSTAAVAGAGGADRFLTLCYHDVVSRRSGDLRAVEEVAFVEQIEFLRAQGAHFLTIDELLAAREGRAKLPAQSVLLTFDDGCKSFRRRVLPVLRMYRIPAVLAVVTSWSEEFSGADCEGGVMGWDEIAEVARSGLVEVASHSHDLHRAVPINPLGSSAAAASRRYYPGAQRHETEAGYRARIGRDLGLSARVLEAKLGRRPRVLAWPYGEYSAVAVEEARRAGFDVLLTLRDDIDGGIGRVSDLETVPRRMLENYPSLETFARAYWAGGPAARVPPDPEPQRVIHADLDMLYDRDAGVMRKNVDRFLERVAFLKPSAVYLQAFCDEAGTGNVSSVYFPNRVLPMKADLFSFVMRALQVRNILVYAWMPTLSLVLPDAAETKALRVRQLHGGKPRPSRADYQRLSPFSAEARRIAADLFEDLAIAAPIDGVLFQDDAYLDEDEDFHPAALEALQRLGIDPAKALTPKQARAWTARKTAVLIEWTDAMMAAVRRHRPDARAARTLYAPTLIEPESKRWFAQSYPASLRAYDEVVVMAYPLMEKVDEPLPWLRRLVAAARAEEGALHKTVFKVQTVDWRKKEACVPPDTLAGWMSTLVKAGARHLAYYPDDLFEDCPKKAAIREFISTERFPLAPYQAANPR